MSCFSVFSHNGQNHYIFLLVLLLKGTDVQKKSPSASPRGLEAQIIQREFKTPKSGHSVYLKAI